MEDFWNSICQVLERRHSTLKFKWNFDPICNGVNFLIENSDGLYVRMFFENNDILRADKSYDTDSAWAIVNHISHIIFDKFQED